MAIPLVVHAPLRAVSFQILAIMGLTVRPRTRFAIPGQPTAALSAVKQIVWQALFAHWATFHHAMIIACANATCMAI
jgi:hypothetical protein